MIKVRSFFQNLINIPSSDPDDSRRRRLLNVLLLGVAILPIPLIPISVIYSDQLGFKDQGAGAIIGVAVAVIIVSMILYVVNRYFSGPIAAILFLLFLSFVFLYADTPQELANGRSLLLFTIPIAFSSMLLSPSSSFAFAVISSLEITGLALEVGIFPNAPAMVAFFALALVSWLSSRGLQQALGDLRSINANLDKVVQERTQALADSLNRERIQAGRNEAILNSIADGVIVFDRNSVASLANPAIGNLLETSLGRIIGQDVKELLTSGRLSEQSKGMLLKLIEQPQQAGESLRLEWGRKTLSVNAALVSDTAGEHIGTVAVFRDFTREAEIERMKSAFVAVVSHELRTPLNAILGYAEMLKEAVFGPITDKQKTATERIMSNTQRLLNLVGDLLDQAQIEAGRLRIKTESFKPAELLESVHGVMDQITADKNLKLSSDLDPDLPQSLLGDSHRLQQILINLVNNSVKFTSEGEIQMHLFRNNQTHWGVEVRDTGVGIPEDEIPHIFETFHQVDDTATREYGGIGLGLAIVKHLVDLMQGEIVVKSQQGNGSSFTVILPLITIDNSKETIHE